jgi:carboxypeptidase Q
LHNVIIRYESATSRPFQKEQGFGFAFNLAQIITAIMKMKYFRFAASSALALLAILPSASTQVFAASDADGIGFDIIEGLTTEVGARQAGTEAEARARVWAIAKLKALGFANVREENYQMPTWVRGQETAHVISPVPAKMAITAIGNSASTGEAGLSAPVVYFPTLDDLKAAPEGSLAGKIAFVSHGMHRTQDGSSYGAFGPARFVGPNIAAKKGALAIIIRSAGTDYHRNPHTGNTNFEKDVKPIPAGALSIPDAENLERIIKLGKPVSMHLKLTPQNLGMQQSGNVIAELIGTDASLPPILIACHLDSWDLGTGAIDDAAGCGIITEAAKQLMHSGKHKRTIRLLWAGAEEVGVWGGKAYQVKYADSPHALAMEADFGADRVWKVNFSLPKSAIALRNQIAKELYPLGISSGKEQAEGGADVEPIIKWQDLAVIDLQQDGTRYFDLHHTPDDTLDKIDKAQLEQTIAAWTIVLKNVANYEGDFKMPPKLYQVEEK